MEKINECGSCAEHHLVLEHHNTLGALVESVGTLKDGMQELKAIASENSIAIEGLSKDVRNGLKKTIEDSIQNLNKEVANLKRTAWVGELFDKTWKKFLGILILVITFISMNTATFGLMQKFNKDTGANIKHYHVLKDDKLLIHVHEKPDGPVVIENIMIDNK